MNTLQNSPVLLILFTTVPAFFFGSPLAAAEGEFPLPSIQLLLRNSCRANYVCQTTELCNDPGFIAIDNNCNGQTDEECLCQPGIRQSCFMGDPSYRYAAGCYPGTQECLAPGIWGPCEGGVHATDNCFLNDQTGCHPLSSRPFVKLDLKSGTGNFSSNAISENWTVTCPDGVSPCPSVTGSNPADDFQPLASGEYTVTYSKVTGTGPDSCTYPLFIGAPGLRVELNWEWDNSLGPSTVDLDLHLHKPGDTNPWGGDTGNTVDCAFDNCTAFDCISGSCPNWFSGTAPPDPVRWYLDPVYENNTCYFAPKGVGQDWQTGNMGCHNPRLDMDNITCDPTVTDPLNNNYCTPENINIDYPPLNQWTRIGVHYYSNHSQTYNVHPEVKVFCDGRLAATLGPTGYYNFVDSVTFSPADSTSRFWLAADVVFKTDGCGSRQCIVQPIYADTANRTPYLTTVDTVKAGFTPPYPILP